MVIVSACLLGERCKYNGGNNYSERIERMLEGEEILPVCPEFLAGLGVPRAPMELVDGVPYNVNGECLKEKLDAAIDEIKRLAIENGVSMAILKSRSPTCGVKEIYDGSFSHTLIPGMGILARALADMGITVIDSEDDGIVI